MLLVVFIDKVAFATDIPKGCERRVKQLGFNNHVFSELKFKLRERQKKGFKKLVKADKGTTFAPATTQRLFDKLARYTNPRREFIF